MSNITRRFTVTAARQGRQAVEQLQLGTAVEWGSENIVLELNVIPVGNWWSGVATIQPEGTDPADISPTVVRRYDLVAAKRDGADGKTRWIKVGYANELASGTITADFEHIPAGSWWDGKVRLFVQKERASKRRAGG